MLIHRDLFDPIKLGDGMKDEMFLKYIEIRDRQYRLLPTMPEITAEVRERFFTSHTDVDKKVLWEIWNFMKEPIQRNEALARFILDYGGAESDFFFPWVMSVAHSPSEALELSYNAGRNLNGEWVECIPENDSINYFVRNLPTLAYNRERQLRVADLVTTDRDVASTETPSRVIDLGAGRMAWARHHGFKFKLRLQSILACDMDARIVPEKLFSKPLSELGIEYRHGNILEELQTMEADSRSLALLQGVASYYPMDVFREGIVKPVYKLLRSGCNFFFDLQLKHISYLWSVKVFEWPEMKLPETASQAIDMIEMMRKELWLAGFKFQAEYILDTYNVSPLSVMIVLTKI